MTLRVAAIDKRYAGAMVEANHYLHRTPPISHAIGLLDDDGVVGGVITLGTPASREVQKGACPDCPSLVIELNRIWVSDDFPRNTESWFISRALKLLPPLIVVSYADTARGHMGYVYRAANFHYAGWTDMERKSPRVDYVTDGKHSRDTFRSGMGKSAIKVPRKPKVKYWTVTGDRRDRKRLEALMQWPLLSWKQYPPPVEHQQLRVAAYESGDL